MTSQSGCCLFWAFSTRPLELISEEFTGGADVSNGVSDLASWSEGIQSHSGKPYSNL